MAALKAILRYFATDRVTSRCSSSSLRGIALLLIIILVGGNPDDKHDATKGAADGAADNPQNICAPLTLLRAGHPSVAHCARQL